MKGCCTYLLFVVLTTPLFGQRVQFAVIGDFGKSSQPEADVAALVAGWNPDFVITTGDNNYEYGEATTIDLNIGQYYHAFIAPYAGSYGTGDTVNRFFPSLGNHDWIQPGAAPYFSYFTLPGNERYYDIVRGPVHLFCIDSDPHEPDGNTSASVQAAWLQAHLAAAVEPWKIVYFHHPPYSSGTRHGSTPVMQWPFRQWGATAVLSGHEHDYERLLVDSVMYFVNGIGGKDLYAFGTPVSGSLVRYNSDFGAQRITATPDSIVFDLVSRAGLLVDSYVIRQASSVTWRQGWNLLSLPARPADPRKTVLFPGASSPAFRFNGSSYVQVDSLVPGAGYWLKFLSAGSLPLFDAPLHEDTVDVVPGWNMIGSPSAPMAAAGIIQIPGNILLTPLFEFATSYLQADTLRPGRGYWARAREPGRLVLH